MKKIQEAYIIVTRSVVKQNLTLLLRYRNKYGE